MWVKTFLLSISLLGLIIRATSQLTVKDSVPVKSGYKSTVTSVSSKEKVCKFILFASKVLKSGNTGQVCIYIGCKETVQLNVALEYNLTTTPIFNDQISAPLFNCRDIQVPKVYETELAYVSFTATGKTVDERKRRAVAIDNMPEACFVQCEKNMYKPGDTIRCRIFCLNYNLRPTKQNFTRICLMEPTGACVQILKPVSDHYMISVEAVLSSDAAPGYYSLRCERVPGNPVIKGFPVERYMLPRYDSNVKCPSTLSVLEKSAEIEISSQYVYGESLPGTVIGKCCRKVRYIYGREKNCFRYLEDICESYTGELVSGTYNLTLNLDKFKMQSSDYDRSIQCEFTIKEAGTGVLDTKSCYIGISSQLAYLELDYSYYYSHYKCGIDYPFALTLKNEKGEPMPNEIILIEVNGIEVKKVTTDAQGRVECAIDTTTYVKPNITFTASYTNEDQCYSSNGWSRYPWQNSLNRDYPYIEWIVFRFYAESNSYVQMKQIPGELICLTTYNIEVKYKVTEAAVGKGTTITTFYYMVRGREEIILHGQQSVDLTNSCEGSFSIEVFVTHKFATGVQVMVFGVTETEMISDKIQLQVQNCFENQVTLIFTDSVVEPGSEVQQQLHAAPGSLCGLRTKDASLDILRPYDDFNPSMIYSNLQYYWSGSQALNQNLEDPEPPCVDSNTEVFYNGGYWHPISSPTDSDTHDNIQSMEMNVVSNLKTRKYQVCGMEAVNTPYNNFRSDAVPANSLKFSMAGSAAAAPTDTVRSNFAETCGFLFVIAGQDGNGIAVFKVPDGITTWKSNMVCISETKGVGFTNVTAEITTFLPVFVEMTTVQFCTRGEKVIITVSFANYLDGCVTGNITVTASDGSKFNLLSIDGEICICKGERASRQWSVEFTSLGNITITATVSTTRISDSCLEGSNGSPMSRSDTVLIVVYVAAEGIKTEFTSSHLTTVNDSTIENYVTIESPDHLVTGSCKLYVTVVGDTVGLMLENFNNLLQLPDGCCDQNLVRLLPVACLLRYMERVGIVDTDLNEKAKSHLIAGYGRHLACRRNDGSFSLFRNSDEHSSWLNIDTYYAFGQIGKYIDIDTNIQQQMLFLLGKDQDLKTGCFNPIGPLFTIQEYKNSSLLFTAYVVQRLQQSNLYGIGGPLLKGGQRCILNADLSSMDIVTFAFVFHSAAVCKLPIWEVLFMKAKETVIIEGGRAYWRSNKTTESRYVLPYGCHPENIMITSNILLGILRGSNRTQEHMDFLGQIATWLSSCQNSQGGFISSKDTIAGIEALAEFAPLVSTSSTNAKVVVSQGGTEVARINVTEENKVQVQRQHIPVVFGKYKVITTGNGSPMVQITSICNIEVKNEGSPFLLNVTTRAEICIKGVAQVIYTDICATYKGSKNITGMVLIVVRELTGYKTDRLSVYQMVDGIKVSEVEFRNNEVHFYIKSMMNNVQVCITIKSFMDKRALMYKDSTVMIQDYYDPGVSGFAKYTHPCSPLLAQ